MKKNVKTTLGTYEGLIGASLHYLYLDAQHLKTYIADTICQKAQIAKIQ